MQAVILAAGRGKRMGEIGGKRSKAMMPILGVPLIERVMQPLVENGVDDIILVIKPQDQELIRYITELSQIRVQVTWVEQTQSLGMAHALHCAIPKIPGSFILTTCDNLLASSDVHRMLDSWQHTADLQGLLALMHVSQEAIVTGAMVLMEGNTVRRIIEKPSPEEIVSKVASLPFYLFSREILTFLSLVKRSPRGEFELQEAIQLMINSGGKVSGIFIPWRMTLTHPADLIALNSHFMVGQANAPQQLRKWAVLIPPYHIDNEVQVGPDCVIGPNVYIESGCRIGERVRVRDAVLLRSARIPDGVEINGQVWG